MGKGGWIIGSILVGVLAVPAAVFHLGGGGWMRDKLLALHGMHGSALHAGAGHKASTTADVTVPFELVTGHVMVRASVNGSAPLWFILDTGDKYAIVDLDRAKALGVPLGAEIAVKGVGPAMTAAFRLQAANWTLQGLPGFTEPAMLAMPLGRLARQFGHDVDGIVGADFLSAFVVEIDYGRRVLVLHDKDSFVYRGAGEALPIRLTASGHPVVQVSVTPGSGAPIPGAFTFDIGAGGGLSLHSPFARDHGLPEPGAKTVRAIGRGGTGGASAGVVTRMRALTLGRFQFTDLPVVVSQDTEGAFAGTDEEGNIGRQILSRFTIFLDYPRSMIYLEPGPHLADAFSAASAGLRLEADGPGYSTFHVGEILEHGPAAAAGLEPGDVITAIDGRPATDWTMTSILDAFERPVARSLTIARGGRTLIVKLLPAILV